MSPISPRELRVSDAEREHVVNVLQKAIGQGMISLDEFSARTDLALAARTRGELNAVLVDLPGMVNREPGSPTCTPPLELRATMSSIKRDGRWEVPRELVVRAKMGSTELDFTEAVIRHDEVHVEVDVAGGSVDLLLPAGSSCESNGVQVTAGSVTDKSGRGPRGGGPHFVVSGAVRAGSLTIKRPSYVRIGSLSIRRPWKISWDA